MREIDVDKMNKGGWLEEIWFKSGEDCSVAKIIN